MFEIIVALGIFALLVVALAQLSAGGYTGFLRGGEYTQAQSLVSEAVEALRSVREGAWNEIVGTNVVVSLSGGAWQVTSGVSELVDNKYTRKIELTDVCRDSAGSIVSCPATGTNYKDPYAKQANISVSWGLGNTATTSLLLTNWDSKDWTQTDWKDGGGQVIWSDPEKYGSGVNTDHSFSGQISLAPTFGSAIMARSAGGPVIQQTTESEFNAGAFVNTQVSGLGSAGAVELQKSFQIVLDPASGVVTTKGINAIGVVPGSEEAWAVGNGGLILHYIPGTGWQLIPSVPALATRDLNAIHVISQNHWVAVGGNAFLEYQDGMFSAVAPTGYVANGVHMMNDHEGWAVGRNKFIGGYSATSSQIIIPSTTVDYNFNDVYEQNGIALVATQLSGNGAYTWRVAPYTGFSSWRLPAGLTQGVPMAIHGDGTYFWSVGTNGRIDRIVADGGGYGINSYNVASNADLEGIFMVSPTDGWAVGSGGRIFRFNGTSWQSVPSPATTGLRDVVMTSPTSGWVVGSSGTILKIGEVYVSSGIFESDVIDSGSQSTTWDVTYWSQSVPVGSSISLRARTGNTPTPDASWTNYGPSMSQNLSSAPQIAPGQYMQYQATLTRGADPSFSPELSDISFIIFRPPVGQALSDVAILSSNEVWAVGNQGSIIHTIDGVTWVQITPKPTLKNLFGVAFFSPRDGWAVGEAGVILHYDGSNWTSVVSPTNKQLNSIVILNENEGRIAGHDGTMLRWNGSAWVSESFPVDNRNLNDVDIVDSPTGLIGYAVGSSGFIAKYGNGSWGILSSGTSKSLQTVEIVNYNDVWTGGQDGKTYHTINGGSSWPEVVTGINSDIRSIVFSNALSGYGVGVNGKIIRYTGLWSSLTSPVTQNLHSIALLTPYSGWIVGANSTVLQFFTTYSMSGSFISSAFNMTDNSPAQIVEWDQDIPQNCSPPTCAIRLQISTAPDASGVPGVWSEWVGPEGLDGDETDYFISSKGELISAALNGKRWVRYRVFLDGDAQQNYTPILKEVRVNYK